MPDKTKLALIVAKPDHLWIGVQSLLRTLPEIEIIAEIKDPEVLMKMNRGLQPDLILLDASLFDEDISSVLAKIKGEWSQTRCLVVVEDSHDKQAMYAAGADLVVSHGFPATKFVVAIEELLRHKV